MTYKPLKTKKNTILSILMVEEKQHKAIT